MTIYFRLLFRYGTQDIEYVLKAIEEFYEFSKTHAHKFFMQISTGGNGHQMIIFGNTSYTYAQINTALDSIRQTIEKEVFANYSWNHDESDTVLLQIYNPIFELLKIYSERIHIGTTNYDRAIEEFCSDSVNTFRYIDGFSHDINTGRDLWTNGDFTYLDSDATGQNVYLYKLHGSITWKRHKKYGIERLNYERISSDPNHIQECLIYPTLDPKNAREEEPYKSVRENFERVMKDIDFCIVIGFSFRDTHVNEICKDFITRGKTLIVIAPHAIKDFHIHVLGEFPSDDEIANWEQESIKRITKSNAKGPDDRNIILIQKRLEVGNVTDIVHDIKRELEPEKDPF